LGLGAVGLKKAWDKFAPTKKAKLARAQKKIDKQKKKESDAETHADAKAVKFDKDEDGYIASAGDAEKYKKIAGKAPAGWETGDDGKVVKKGDKPKEEPKPKESFEPEKDMTLDESSKKARNKAADEIEKIADKGGAEAPTLFSLASKLRKGTHSTTGLKLSKQVTAILKDNGIKEGLEESNELQAIMALDDEGISAEINRKGQVVVKKKDLKKAQKALKKSFRKGGEPKLVGEGVRTAYEVVSEARSKIIEAVDTHAAVELYNFMQNERDLQRQKDSIIKNIVRKKKSGKYDHSRAPKLWMYWVDNGAKAYDKLYSSPGAKTFDKDTRESVAIQLANEYNAEIDLGNYS